MKTFYCEDMACGHCVSRIETALKEAGIAHQVDLETKTVKIEGEDTVIATSMEILDDLGFTPVEK